MNKMLFLNITLGHWGWCRSQTPVHSKESLTPAFLQGASPTEGRRADSGTISSSEHSSRQQVFTQCILCAWLIGKTSVSKTSVAPALLELNCLVKWLAVNKHHTSNIIAMKINAVMGKSRTYIVYGGTQEGLPKGGMLRLRCEVLVLARQIGRAKFPRKKKQHVQGPWGQKLLNESKEHRTD